ncbi:MAG: hypothetical protein ABIW49_00360 [Knoellia sp.]
MINEILQDEAVKRLNDHRAGEFMRQAGLGIASRAGFEGTGQARSVVLVWFSEEQVTQRNRDDLPVIVRVNCGVRAASQGTTRRRAAGGPAAAFA